MREPIRQNDFAHLLISQAALELCLVVEELLRHKVPSSAKTLGRMLEQYPKGHGVAFTGSEIQAMSRAFDFTSFDPSLAAVLSTGRVPGITRALTVREQDLAVVYAVRNKSAHGLARPTGVAGDLGRVIERLFFAIFAAFEGLYR